MLLVNGAGGVTGGMVATLARVRGTRMIATAGPTSADRLKRLGVEAVYDYHDHDWPNAVRALSRGTGVPAAVTAARGGEPTTFSAVAEGGRLPPSPVPDPSPSEGVDRRRLRACRRRAAAGPRRTAGPTGARSPYRPCLPTRRRSVGAGARDGRGARGAVVLSRNPPSASVVKVGRVRRTGVYWNRWLSRSVTRSENRFRTGRISTALETASARRPLRRDCDSDHSESFAGLVIRS
jgi:hypothetical protein